MDSKLTKHLLEQIINPTDYFHGIGEAPLTTPYNLLMYVRKTKYDLQQTALENRSHHRFVLFFNMGTKGVIHVNHLDLEFSPGQALLIFPYQFHHFSLCHSTTLNWLFCTFEQDDSSPLESLRNQAIPVGKQSKDLTQRLVRSWIRPESKFKAAEAQCILLNLLCSLQEDQSKAGYIAQNPDTGNDGLILSINQLLTAWHSRPVTIEDIAAELNCSESYLRNNFKKTAGVSLGQYLMNYKLNRAMYLLKHTNFSMAEIAQNVGYESQQAFSTSFKKKMGQAPLKYRG